MTTEKLWKVRSSDGTEIGVFSAGDGPPLVLVHGTTADHTRWANVLEPLAARFTVHAIDRRGRGASGDTEPYALEREFDDVAAVVDAIGGPVSLLGHSHGALVSLEAALRTTNLARLVLYEPPIPVGIEIYTPGIVDRLEQLVAAGERETALETFFREVALIPEETLATMKGLPMWQARVAAAHTIPREEHAGGSYVFEPERFRGLVVPTRLLLGGESPPFLTEPAWLLEKTLPDAHVVVLPGQHHVAMDTAPELFLHEVVSFLTS